MTDNKTRPTQIQCIPGYRGIRIQCTLVSSFEMVGWFGVV